LSNDIGLTLKIEVDDDRNFSDDSGTFSEGEIDVSNLIVAKQMPKVQASFHNAFTSFNRPSIEVRDNTFEEASTLERIL